jgi:large subunit ribosomal protein L20
MPRATNNPASKRRRKKMFKAAKGYYGRRKDLVRNVKDALLKAHSYAYRDRKRRKRDFRRLWITRINAAAKAQGISYNRLIHGLKEAGIDVDRKVLADLAVNDIATFNQLIEVARSE